MDQAGETFTSAHDPGLLAAYIEGRLDENERRALTMHLGACADCRQILAMLARAPGVLPLDAKRRRPASPVWLALAATVILATFAVRRLDGPIAGGGEERPAFVVRGGALASPTPLSPRSTVVEASPRARAPVGDPMLDPDILVKRGAVRRAGGKTFRLVAGEWVDGGLDSAAGLPTVQIKGPDERAAIVRRMPALRPYAALGDRVAVAFEGTVYRFTP